MSLALLEYPQAAGPAAMTITCATCGRDSGVCAALDEAETLALERDAWTCAMPRIGQPFRFYCPACTQAARQP
jgi:hypothetical protein